MSKAEGDVLHSLARRKVTKIGDKVIKDGPNLRVHEAETLRFIAANTSIPVPNVHDVRWQDGRVTEIVMDFVPGKTLEDAWENMDSNQKACVTEELRGYMCELRQLKGSYIGALDRGPVIAGKYGPLVGGPFDTEQQFNEFLLGDIARSIPDLLRHYAKHALDNDHEIVFTHADFAPRNVLVDDQGHVTAIIDWEDSGWYPEYWEYVKAMRELNSVPDWPEYLSQILPPRYEKEYIGMTFLNFMLRT
ncbi:hypothetical protein ASPWEDRAFT_167965 [Aspergillus wentii DTO 134E9]|uniref:Aminoglycoside phosphotransferase domain-containing protein n=1 Tax=Aspergillus wentii DTO 134E9 TaxID=1073089 RepID=A0A1L9RT27_ASPWE|nr:uncharacterized protein ASPWEDRAFT_167965 [Aspergillus wentii DTO 134E9]KAI9933695.1 hypothetical protein MW887_004766 [Aspergillus wentii]OJJ38033.1 hypothetical protein ASPWEDRAFT_167965 [Aspergillus wentii DTO 134E9]